MIMNNCVEKIGSLIGKFRDLYAQINQLTLSGACDVVVVRNEDTGQLNSTPFYVRFGFLDLAVPKRHLVNIIVNDVRTDLRMYVGDSGFAYFSDDQKRAEENLKTVDVNYSESESQKDDSASPLKILSGDRTSIEESVINELEHEIEKDSIDMDAIKHHIPLTSESETKNEEVKNSRFQRINNWVKKHQRNSVNSEAALSMNFDLQNFDSEMIAINSDNNCTTTPDGYLKTLCLSPEQLESLNLQKGCNKITFKLVTAFQGKRTIDAQIFLWDSNDKVICSDFDGTVTKSDMLGHFLPLFGKQWHQQYVSKLFEKIEQNGYKILYITMRPLGYSSLTKKQLRSVRINETNLPVGPLLLCPLTFFNSLNIEIVFKAAGIMKYEILKHVTTLFGNDKNPLHAGFGNMKSDENCYNQLGISPDLNFIINTKGQVTTSRASDSEHQTTGKNDVGCFLSYKKILDNIDTYFPPI